MFDVANWAYSVLGKMSSYAMDDAGVCGHNKTTWLKDDEHATVLGKTKPPKDNIFKDCSLKLAPNKENKNKFLQLRFDSFYIKDCDVELEIHQAPSTSPEDTKELVLLNCRSNFPQVLYGEEDHQIHLKLERADKLKVDYNFTIDVTCTEGPVESGIGSPAIIGLAVGGGVVLLFLLLLLTCMWCRRSQTGNQSDRTVPNTQNTTVSNDSVQIEVGNEPPLTSHDDRNSPECCLLMSNAPQSPNDDNDANVSILSSAPPLDSFQENSPRGHCRTSYSARRT